MTLLETDQGHLDSQAKAYEAMPRLYANDLDYLSLNKAQRDNIHSGNNSRDT